MAISDMQYELQLG